VVNAFCERNRDDSRLCVPDCIGDPTCRAPFCTRVSDDSDDTNDLVCEPCTEDGDCDAGEVCDADSGACTPGCLVSDACEANEVCDRDLTCKQAGCSSDEDCSGETPVCDLTDGVCQECLLDSQCTDETPFCVEEEGAFNCEECVEDTDCSDDGQFCTGEAVCNGFECSFTGNPCDSNEECDEEADECVEPAPTPECGDGTVDEGEECDDGNTDSGDGCSSTCTVETDEPGPVDPGNGGGEGLSATGGNAIDCSSTGTGHAPLGGTALILFGLLAIRRKNRAE
jgi:MYXO-CTERM domain-containing protein